MRLFSQWKSVSYVPANQTAQPDKYPSLHHRVLFLNAKDIHSPCPPHFSQRENKDIKYPLRLSHVSVLQFQIRWYMVFGSRQTASRISPSIFSAQGKTSSVAQFRLEQKRTKKQQITFFKNGIPHYTCIIHRESKNPLLTVGHNII